MDYELYTYHERIEPSCTLEAADMTDPSVTLVLAISPSGERNSILSCPIADDEAEEERCEQ